MFMMLFCKNILFSMLMMIPLLICVAYFTLAERKLIATIQRSSGPHIVGFFGTLQPFADGLKLVIKEILVPTKVNKLLFLLAPMITFFCSFLSWAIMPFNIGVMQSDLNLSIFYLMSVSCLSVYGIMLAGWASNSRYSFLGALRATAQMLSYDVYLGLGFMSTILLTGSINLTDIVLAQQNIWFMFPLLPIGLIFFISMLVETNSSPFDLPEAEAEIVAGYNLEYSGMLFTMFFLGEYSNMLLMSTLFTILFLGGWQKMEMFNIMIMPEFIFALKVMIIAFFFILMSAALPRYSFDYLMKIGWKYFLPMTMSYMFIIVGFIFFFNMEPYIII